MNISNLETCTFPIQTARSECGKSSFVSELGEWIGLIHDLRQFTTPEEVLDCRGNTLGIHERARRQVLDILQAHAFLNSSTQFEEALSEFVGGQFFDRTQAPISKVIDVIDSRG